VHRFQFQATAGYRVSKRKEIDEALIPVPIYILNLKRKKKTNFDHLISKMSL